MTDNSEIWKMTDEEFGIYLKTLNNETKEKLRMKLIQENKKLIRKYERNIGKFDKLRLESIEENEELIKE